MPRDWRPGMDQKKTNQRLADALGGTERSLEQLRYKSPTNPSTRLLLRLLTALDEGRKVVMSGKEWELEFHPELRRKSGLENSMFLIRPYKYQGHWVFDDEDRALKREPFVGETEEVFDVLTAGLEGVESGFTLQFSDRRFPGWTVHLVKSKEEYGGWWYELDETGMLAWFGQPLLVYFPEAPDSIYAQART